MAKSYILFSIFFIICGKYCFAEINNTQKEIEQSIRDSRMVNKELRINDKLDKMNFETNNRMEDMNNQFRTQNDRLSLEQNQKDNENFNLQMQGHFNSTQNPQGIVVTDQDSGKVSNTDEEPDSQTEEKGTIPQENE